MSMVIAAGQRGDSPQFGPVLKAIRVPRMGQGRPRTRPDRVRADKAYTSGRTVVQCCVTCPNRSGCGVRSEAGEQVVEWGGDVVGGEGLDEDAAVVDLAPLLRAEKASQLLLWGAVLLCGLPQEGL